MKKITTLFIILISGSAAFSQTLKTHADSVSYALGISMAETLKKSGITEYNEATLMEAISAQIHGKATMDAMTSEKIFREESKKIADVKANASKKAGEDYLKANAGKPGVKTSATGLQYKTNVEGTGKMPDSNDKVTVHYHGTLIDGTVFDSSVDRGTPASFGLNQVIPGWTEGLQYMKEGGKTTFYIPSNLAYGSRGQGKIAANSTLIFDVELISVEPVEGTAATAAPSGPPAVKPATPQAAPSMKPATPQAPPAPPAAPAPAKAPKREKK